MYKYLLFLLQYVPTGKKRGRTATKKIQKEESEDENDDDDDEDEELDED